MIAYKFLAAGGVGRFSDVRWTRPAGGSPGPWVVAGEPIAPCRHGVHACRRDHLPHWLDDELWLVELAGCIVEEPGLVVAERGRLVRPVTSWDEQTAAEFTRGCLRAAQEGAVRALERAGCPGEAKAAAGADPRRLRSSFARLAASVPEPASTACAFVADAVALAAGGRPGDRHRLPAAGPPNAAAVAANLGFVVAHAIGAGRAALEGPDAYEQGVAAERTRQVQFLAERLGLDDG